MAVDISRFTQILNGLDGVARTSHFVVEINTPPVLGPVSSAETLSLMCQGTSLPGIAIGTDDHTAPQGYGLTQKMPWGVLFSDMDLTFLGDNKGVTHNLLTTWLNSIVMFNVDDVVASTSTGQPFFVSYKKNYATTVIVRAYDDRQKSIMEFKLYDAFPTAIYDVGGDWGAQNDIVRLRVRMAYTRWTVKYQKLTFEQQRSIRQLANIIDTSLAGNALLNREDVSDALNNAYNQMVSQPNTQAAIQLVDSYKRSLPSLGGLDYFSF